MKKLFLSFLIFIVFSLILLSGDNRCFAGPNSNIDDLDEFVTVTGYVYSLDTPDQPVADIVVTIYDGQGTYGSAVTDVNGYFSIGNEDIETGNYNFYLSPEYVGRNIYHEIDHNRTVDVTGEVTLGIFEILPPSNFQTHRSDTDITLTWDAPANSVDVTSDILERLENQVANCTHIEKQNYYRQKLEYYNQLYQQQRSELDFIEDLQGFRIIDGSGNIIAEVGVNMRSFEIQDLDYGQEYSFAIAADYGYDDEYFVYTDFINQSMENSYFYFREVEYEWYSVIDDPDHFGIGLTEDGELYVTFLPNRSFNFFGIEYSGVTVGANGGISFINGAQIPWTISPLPGLGAPPAFVAPFWADLEGNNVVGTYDDDGNMWISWDSNFHGSDQSAQFEIKLDFWDNSILFQYNHSDSWHLGSIGLQDHNQEVAFSWSVNELIAAGGEEYALKFEFVDEGDGQITGLVTDTYRIPQEGVQLWLDEFLLAETNEAGIYQITINPGVHDIVFTKDGYLPYELSVEVDEGEVTYVGRIPLLTAEIEATPDELDIVINLIEPNPQFSGSISFDLENISSANFFWNGEIHLMEVPDHWNMGSSLPGAAGSNILEHIFGNGINNETSPLNIKADNNSNLDQLWTNNWQWFLEEAEAGSGVVITENALYVIEWDETSSTNFLEYDFLSNLVRSEELPQELRGIRDLAWDGAYLYGGNVEDNGAIYRFEPDFIEGYELIANAPGYGRGIALDFSTGDIYTTNPAGICKIHFDNSSYELTELNLPDFDQNIYGCAWMPIDPDGMNLWLLCQPEHNGVVFRVNPETMEVDDGLEIYHDFDGPGAGIDIFNSHSRTMWNTVTLLNSNPVRIDFWEGYFDPVDWMSLSLESGVLEPGQSQQIILEYDVEDHPILEMIEDDDQITAMAVFRGDYRDGLAIPLRIRFDTLEGQTPENEVERPNQNYLEQNYPNPFNAETTISFNLVQTGDISLTIHNILGQEIKKLYSGNLDAGYHTFSLNAFDLASGIYFCHLQAGEFKDIKKMILIK